MRACTLREEVELGCGRGSKATKAGCSSARWHMRSETHR